MRLPPALVLAAAASAWLAVPLSSQSPPAASPERVVFDAWLDGQARLALDARRERVAALRTRADLEAYQREVRSTLAAGIGPLPADDRPPSATVTRTTRRDGYRIEHLIFESLPGLKVTALVYVPDGAGPHPAVIGTAGHADEGKASATYQHAWVSLVRRGFVVLAYDPPGQGERLEYLDPRTGGSRVGIGTREHTMTGQQVLLTGRSLAAYMVQDGRRAIDYLQTRTDVDASRIAVAGNSGGGTQAALLAAIDPRLTAAIVSCYMTSWRDMWQVPGPQDAEQILPGFVGHRLDFADFAIAAAPRGFLVSSAVRDFFPIAGSRAVSQELVRLYQLLDAPDKLDRVEADATHGWSQPLREGAYAALGRWLMQRRVDAGEAPVVPETVDALRVTTSGQLATSEGSRTIRATNAEEASRLVATRPADTTSELRRLLQLSTTGRQGRVASRSGNGATSAGETIQIKLHDGLLVKARLRRSTTPTARVVVLLDDRGATRQDATIEALARNGQHVLAVDIRGTGALGPTAASSGYAPDYQFAARAWLLGTSVVAWQGHDIHASLAVLEQLLPGERLDVTLHARGQTGPAALFASLFVPPAALVLEDSLVSYHDLVTADVHEGLTLTIVPGILRVTDLPAVMTQLGSVPVRLVRPRAASGVTITAATLARHLHTAVPPNVSVVQ